MKDPELERLAAAYRGYRRPSPERRARIEAAVLRDARGAAWMSPRLWLAVGGVAAAVVLTWMAADFRERQGASPREPSSEAAYVSETVASDNSIHRVAPGVGEPFSTESQRPRGGETEVSSSPRPRPPSSSSPRSRSRDPAPEAERTAADRANAGLDLTNATSDVESMRWLRQAERDLSHDPARALVRLREHLARYPRTPLALERDALFVLALCQMGDQTQGRERRTAFLHDHPNSVYESRIRAACSEHHEK